MNSANRFLQTVLRVGVGVVLVLYGLAKFFRLQAFDVQVSGDIRRIDPSSLFWFFFGYSNVYLFFLGVIETATGIALLFRRTHRVGALAAIAVMANITVMDFVYEIGPVRFWALFLTLCSIAIVVMDVRVYLSALAVLTADQGAHRSRSSVSSKSDEST